MKEHDIQDSSLQPSTTNPAKFPPSSVAWGSCGASAFNIQHRSPMVTHPVSRFKERLGLRFVLHNVYDVTSREHSSSTWGDPVAWEYWYELKWIKSMLPAFSHETVQIDHWTHTRNIAATKKCYHIFTLPYAICEFLKDRVPIPNRQNPPNLWCHPPSSLPFGTGLTRYRAPGDAAQGATQGTDVSRGHPATCLADSIFSTKTRAFQAKGGNLSLESLWY